MKTAAQVFIILNMVFGFWFIFPLIFGGIALSNMSKGKKPSVGISLCLILLCGNLIGGILLLVAKDEDFYLPNMNNGYNPNMNNYNQPMNNGYNQPMNNGYNNNMANNAATNYNAPQQNYNNNNYNNYNNQ